MGCGSSAEAVAPKGVAAGCMLARAGGWLPQRAEGQERFLEVMLERTKQKHPLAEPIQGLRSLVHKDRVLLAQVQEMFRQAAEKKRRTPLGTRAVHDFDTFLHVLNVIVTTAPEYFTDGVGSDDPAGLIGFPINAVLVWPMATEAGYAVFANALVNQQLKKILCHWARFLATPESCYVLMEPLVGPGSPPLYAPAIPWLSEAAKARMVHVAFQSHRDGPPQGIRFEDVFQCQPGAEYYGFTSWDDFFTREFVAHVREVAEPDNDAVVVNACESAPLAVQGEVPLDAKFWLKRQPYSLMNMMDFDPLAEQFVGGTVYQAFLSALSYHRWRSPVAGHVVKAFVVNGTYYLEDIWDGFTGGKPDPSAPNSSQAFLSAVATRAVIFIKARDARIGLMCVIAIGMAEVSSCEITVAAGQELHKGDQLGMFHFGGSTHCLVFREATKLKWCDWSQYNVPNGKPGLHATNVPVSAEIARVV